MHTLARLPLTRRFARLPAQFYTRQSPTPLPAPHLMAWNPDLAADLGLHPDAGQHAHLADLLAGNILPAGAEPLASVYSGHQFGVNVPQLGDGRAILIAELERGQGDIYELQLKGAGRTPYSRMGDGRAVLRSSIREYLASEAMHGLGIPTTRALGLAGSPQRIWRETPETAAVVLRVAPTFVRFGHFEYFFWHGEHDSVRILADWVIEHFYPHCRHTSNPYLAMLTEVTQRTADLIAQWQAVGFCHGVMNSDNMSILGLTLDYGPFGFLDGFNANHICNHSDDTGRYAYQQQAEIGLWNLHCLAQAMLPLSNREALLEVLAAYQPRFESSFAEQMRRKLGLLQWQEEDWTLLTELLELMQASQTDWTRFWRALGDICLADAGPGPLRDQFMDRAAFDRWLQIYRQRLGTENVGDLERRRQMNQANPCYVLRNHLAEIAIRAARDQGNFTEIERLRRCLAQPFDEKPEFADYAQMPPVWASAISISCSS